jgi:hypothetical protein
MIDRALSLIARRLNEHLRQTFATSDELVALTGMTDVEGKPAAAARNRLVLFITNLSEDDAARRFPLRTASAEGRSDTADEASYAVHVMLASNFDPEDYLKSLKFLSQGVQFFQNTPVFDHHNSPELDAGLTPLSLEIQNLDTETASRIWGMHGGRYVPSVLYRMRLTAIASGTLTRGDVLIGRPEGEEGPVSGNVP